MRVIHSVVIREKPPSKRPRIRSILKINIEQTAVIVSLQERIVVLAGKVALKLRLQ